MTRRLTMLALALLSTLPRVAQGGVFVELPFGSVFSGERPPFLTGLRFGGASNGGIVGGEPLSAFSGPTVRIGTSLEWAFAGKKQNGDSATRFMWGFDVEIVPITLQNSGTLYSVWALGFFAQPAVKFDPGEGFDLASPTYAFSAGLVISYLRGRGRLLGNAEEISMFPTTWWGVNIRIGAMTTGGDPAVTGLLLLVELPFFYNW